jgi:hypothetical protein
MIIFLQMIGLLMLTACAFFFLGVQIGRVFFPAKPFLAKDILDSICVGRCHHGTEGDYRRRIQQRTMQTWRCHQDATRTGGRK